MQPVFAKVPANLGAGLRRACRSRCLMVPALIIFTLAMVVTLRVGLSLAARPHLRQAGPHPAALTALFSPALGHSAGKTPAALGDDDDDDDDGGDSTPC